MSGASLSKRGAAPPCYAYTLDPCHSFQSLFTAALGTSCRAVAPFFSLMLIGTFML